MSGRVKSGLVFGSVAAVVTIVILGLMLALLPFIGPIGFLAFLTAAFIPPIIAIALIATAVDIFSANNVIVNRTGPAIIVDEPSPVIIRDNSPSVYYTNTTPPRVYHVPPVNHNPYHGGNNMPRFPNPPLPVHGGPAPMPPVVHPNRPPVSGYPMPPHNGGSHYPAQPPVGHGPAKYPTRDNHGNPALGSTGHYPTTSIQNGHIQQRMVNPKLKPMDL
jgi:hypothetical protein